MRAPADLLPFPNPVDGVSHAVAGAAQTALEDGIIALAKAVIAGMAWVFGLMLKVVASTTTPDLGASWFSGPNGPYTRLATVAVSVLAIMVIFGICQAIVSGDPGGVGRRVLVELPAAVLTMTVLLGIVGFGVAVTDAVSAQVLAGGGDAGKTFLDSMVSLSGHKMTLMTAMVLGNTAALMLLASVVIWLEMLVRSALIYLLVALAPLAMATRVWPVTRSIAHRVGHYLAGFILAKLVVAVALAIGLAALANFHPGGAGAPAPPGSLGASPTPTGSNAPTPADAADLGAMLGGAALLAVGALAPFLVIKLLPIAEHAAGGEGIRSAPTRAATTAVATAVTVKSAAR